MAHPRSTLVKSTVVEDGVVHELTTLIQKSGDKILKEQTKLVLTLTVLNCLNRKLRSMKNNKADVSSIDDIVQLSPIAANSDIWLGLECRNAEDELALVEDFFKRLTTVKVTQGFGTVQGSVDISQFECLKVLELRRVPIHLIVGLQSLRPHLKLISCSHCLQSLEDLFASCGGDRCSPFAWPELLSVTLTYNTIDTIGSSLRLLPSLVSLDLGHNQITDTRGLEFLTELQFLNLSYNQLQHLPVLGSRARLRLKVMSVRNNCLETLEGIESFLNLQQADLAFNCILDHCSLAPFLNLPHVVLICLEGNPISFHDKHRLFTAEHLHKGSLLANCTIDSKPLTNAECAAVNRRGSSCRTWKHSSVEVYLNSSINAVSDRPGNIHIHSLNSEVAGDPSMDSDASSDEVRKMKRRSKKSPLIREVSIADDSSTGSKESRRASDVIKVDVESLQASGFTLNAKEQMERFRQQHGNEWLIVGSKLNVLTPVTLDPNGEVGGGGGVDLSIVDVTSASNEPVEKQRQSQISDDVIVLETESEPPQLGSRENIANTDAIGSSDRPSENRDGYREGSPWKEQVSQEDESAEDEDGGDDAAVLPPFIVQMEKPGVDSSTTVLVVVSNRDLREKDALTGRTTERLDLRSICSVESLCPSISRKLGSEWDYPRIKIGFSYVRKDRRERIYTMEDAESYQQFLALLKPLVDAKTLEEITFGALQCLKCSAQFSKDVANRVIRKSWRPPIDSGGSAGLPAPYNFDTSKGYLSEANACPNCASEMLVEIHEMIGRPQPPPQSSSSAPMNRDLNFGDVSKVPSRTQSSFHSSMQRKTAWDVGNLTRGLVRSQSGDVRHRSRRSSSCNVVQVEVEIHAYQQQQQQQNQSDDDAFQRISSSLPFALRRSGSDITILSNPSQSSIMVVPNPSVECANLDVISEANSDAPRRAVNEPYLTIDNDHGGFSDSPTSSACTALEKSIYDLAHTPDSFLSALEPVGNEPLRCNVSSDFKPRSLSDQDEISTADLSLTSSGKNNSSNGEQPRQLNSRDFRTPPPQPLSPSIRNDRAGCSKQVTWSCRNAKMDYSFSDFGDVDHRLRLYLDMQVLVETEELVAVLRVSVVPYVKNKEFPGLLIISRSTVHILRIVKEETDEPHDWLQKYVSKPLAMLFFLNIRLGNQAFQLEFGPKTAGSCFTFLMRDADHCNNFTYFLEKLRTTLEISGGAFQCGLDSEETLQIIREHLLPWRPNGGGGVTSNMCGDNDEEVPIILYLMCYWKPPGGSSLEPVSLAMTAADIYVFREDLHFPVPHLILPPNEILCRPQLIPMDRRAIQDLTSMEQSDPHALELTLTFLDDDTQEEVSLHIAAETAASVQAIVNALKDPWEKLFGVQLQINVIKQLTTPL